MLIGVFLSVHLILDPLQHLLHPPQLQRDVRHTLVPQSDEIQSQLCKSTITHIW